MAYTCDSCSGERPVALLLCSLVNGSTDASCTEDTPLMLIGNLALALGVDPQRLYDTVQKFTAREAAREAKAAEAAEAEAAEAIAQATGREAADQADPAEGADPDDVAAYPERYGVTP